MDKEQLLAVQRILNNISKENNYLITSIISDNVLIFSINKIFYGSGYSFELGDKIRDIISEIKSTLEMNVVITDIFINTVLSMHLIVHIEGYVS